MFQDNFDDDKGWEIVENAASGAWIRGNPVPTTVKGTTAQPGDCGGGESCFFTGQNKDGQPENGDVQGTTVLLSPAFDLTNFTVTTVALNRSFFRSGAETGTRLRIELLIPDTNQADGFRPFVLEKLNAANDFATPAM